MIMTFTQTRLFFICWLIALMTCALLLPQFFSYDSYKYMVLGFFPEGHPYQPHGFAILLRLLAKASTLPFVPSIEILYLLIQSALLALFMTVFVLFVKSCKSRIHHLLSGLTAALCLFLVFPGLFVLANGYWTGLISLAALLGVALMLNEVEKSWKWLSLVVVVMIIGAQMRHQLQILPLAIICVLLVMKMIGRQSFDWRPALLIIVLAFVGNKAINHWYDSHYQPHWYASQYIPNQVRMSIQCRLGCEVELYKNLCSTEQQRSLINNADCTDLLQHRVALSEPVSDKEKVWPIFKQISLSSTLKWLIISPFDYLGEKQKTLEIEQYGFNSHFPGLSAEHPDVFSYYDQKFERKVSQPSVLMTGLTKWMEQLYLHWSIYHILTGILVVLNFVLIFVARRHFSVLFLLFYSLGSYFLYAWFQPQTPFRYLLHVIVPALWGWMLYCIEITRGEYSASTNH